MYADYCLLPCMYAGMLASTNFQFSGKLAVLFCYLDFPQLQNCKS